MFEGIRKLPPAHTITVRRDGKVEIRRYWEPVFESEERPLADIVEELHARLKDSVKHHLVSDVRRGCFLSSGIDSTAIATLTRSIEPIKTFSVGFAGSNDETRIAAETARVLGTEHYAKVITEREFFDTLPKAVWHQDEPVADPFAIALYHVAGFAREHVTVVLSGEGADELFGGYRIYREPLALKPLSWLPRPLQIALNRLASLLPAGMPGRNYLLRATTPLERRFLDNARIFSEEAKAELFANAELLRLGRNPWQIADQYYARTRHLDPVSRMQHIDMNLWLPGDILMKADKMTMAHSLELRVPFLDKELFELARRIPASQRVAHGTTKYAFRRAMEGIVPDFILNRPKLGFSVLLRDWLKGEAEEPCWKKSGVPVRTNISGCRIWNRCLTNIGTARGDYARPLWTVYIFSLWHQTYIAESGGKAVLHR